MNTLKAFLVLATALTHSSAVAHPLNIVAEKVEEIELLKYIAVGFEHIIPEGWDHLLFILALVILSPSLKKLLLSVSLFTLAHTVTLGLSSLQIVQLPGDIVEPLIALSISFMALETFFEKKLQPFRYAVIFFFGLVHGLGFAGAFAELGLPQKGFLTALVGFNLGVELGQFAVVFFAWPITRWLKETSSRKRYGLVPVSLAIASMGVYWAGERIHETLSSETSKVTATLGVVYFDAARLKYPYTQPSSATKYRISSAAIERLSSSELNDLATDAIRVARAEGKDALYAVALEAATRSLKLSAVNNAGAQLVLAEVLQAEHRFEEALRVLEPMRDDLNAFTLFIRVKLGQGDHALALQYAKTLAEKIPGATSYFYLGLVHETMGNTDEAVQMYYAGLQMEDIGEENTSAWGRALLARLYYRNGNLREAQYAAKTSLAVLPAYPLAKEVLSQIESKTKQESKI
jgi:hypothetical protein